MNFLAKNSWLNFVMGLTGFYFVFSIMQMIMGKFGVKMVMATPGTANLSSGFYWVISYAVALVVVLFAIIVFCKPRAPFFVFLGILLAGAIALYHPLLYTILNLDRDARKAGLVALYGLLPHLVVLVGSLIGMYVAWLSNKMSDVGE